MDVWYAYIKQVVRKRYKTAKSFPAHNTSTKQIKQTQVFLHITQLYFCYIPRYNS